MIPSVYTVIETPENRKPYSIGSWKTREEAEIAKKAAMKEFLDRFTQSWYGDNEVFYKLCGDVERVRFDVVGVPLPI